MKFANFAYLLGALVAAAPHLQANLITNGSFESPVTTELSQIFFVGSGIGAWTVVGDTGGSVSALRNGYGDGGGLYGAQDGVQHLDLTGPGLVPRSGVAQSVATTIGSTYDLSFYLGDIYGSTNPPLASGVEVFVGGVSKGTFTHTGPANVASTDWVQKSLQFVALASSTEIQLLRIADPNADAYIGLDNVSVTLAANNGAAILEPSTLALGGLGCLFLLARRRR
ncbi:MAG: DUF642 domain-containing protein [Acidobacteria bacterium]|nr:DUF642 domain-containing protein [Acidobacteriota bacterium]